MVERTLHGMLLKALGLTIFQKDGRSAGGRVPPNDGSRLYSIERGTSRRHDGQCRPDHEEGYVACREILLMLHSLIDGHQNLKLVAGGGSIPLV